MVPHRNPSMS